MTWNAMPMLLTSNEGTGRAFESTGETWLIFQTVYSRSCHLAGSRRKSITDMTRISSLRIW